MGANESTMGGLQRAGGRSERDIIRELVCHSGGPCETRLSLGILTSGKGEFDEYDPARFSCGKRAAAAEGQLHAQDETHTHDHQVVPSDPTLRVKALESLLVEKGLVDPAALDALIDTFEHKIGPRNGARVVARAWLDPAYKQRLLADAPSAITEAGFANQFGDHMVVVE